MDNMTLTIGQYLNGDSWIYKLDPRFKIISTIILMVVIFLIPNLTCMLIALGLCLLMLISARLPLMRIFNGLKPIMFLSIFSFVLQIIYTKEGTLVQSLPMQISLIHILVIIVLFGIYFKTMKYIPFKLTYLLVIVGLITASMVYFHFNNLVISSFNFDIYNEGIINGSFFVLRIALVVILSTLLTLTTSTNDINSGLESTLAPFKVIKLPVSEISIMISLTLRFIPTLLIETTKIMKAQASRGIDFNEGSFMDKVKQIITLLIPMFVVSFKRAEDLANAMEARGYVIGAKRTSLNVLKYSYRDYIGYFIVFALLALTIYLKVIS